MRKIAIEIDCDGEFCGRCKYLWKLNEQQFACGFDKWKSHSYWNYNYIDTIDSNKKRIPECIAAELKDD